MSLFQYLQTGLLYTEARGPKPRAGSAVTSLPLYYAESEMTYKTSWSRDMYQLTVSSQDETMWNYLGRACPKAESSRGLWCQLKFKMSDDVGSTGKFSDKGNKMGLHANMQPRRAKQKQWDLFEPLYSADDFSFFLLLGSVVEASRNTIRKSCISE